jgi:hypothetical protein
VKPYNAVIYGNFRDAWHGMLSADVFAVVSDSLTGKTYELRVKMSSSGAKKYNPFCYYLPAGTYYLQDLKYVYENAPVIYLPMSSPVRKNAGRKELRRLEKTDSLALAPYQKFKFTVAPGTLNYVGTWDATSDTITIYNDREYLDRRLKHGLLKYDKLDFDKGVVGMPE